MPSFDPGPLEHSSNPILDIPRGGGKFAAKVRRAQFVIIRKAEGFSKVPVDKQVLFHVAPAFSGHALESKMSCARAAPMTIEIYRIDFLPSSAVDFFRFSWKSRRDAKRSPPRLPLNEVKGGAMGKLVVNQQNPTGVTYGTQPR